MDEDKCEQCRFVMVTMEECFCRRYPPTLSFGMKTNPLFPGKMETVKGSFYPPTQKSSWCGDFQPKETMQ